MKIKFKKLNEKAVTPTRATTGSAGLDITATSVTQTNEYIEYGTGLAFEIPKGHFGMLVPRSSITKKNLILGNSCGILDQDFRGEITFRFKRLKKDDIYDNIDYKIGERIGQLIILPYPEVELEEVTELEETIRGSGGYGHSGL